MRSILSAEGLDMHIADHQVYFKFIAEIAAKHMETNFSSEEEPLLEKMTGWVVPTRKPPRRLLQRTDIILPMMLPA